jgi:hypothetical protein
LRLAASIQNEETAVNQTFNLMDEKKCQICDQSFNSDRELQEHQNSEHSGNEQGGNRPRNEEVHGDPPVQLEQKRKIA